MRYQQHQFLLVEAIIKIQFLSFILLLVAACAGGSGSTEGIGIEPSDSSFVKNVLIMEFVSFDCVYCPNVTNLLNELSGKTFPGRIDVISVHGRLEENDPMEFSRYRQLQNYFYGVTGYPSVIIDQRDDLVSVGTFDPAGSALSTRINATAQVGIALGSTIQNDSTVVVEVRVANKGKSSDDYRLAVVVLENNIPYKQADLVNGTLQWIDDYRHFHVLRAFLSENYFGDPTGTLAKDSVYTKKFTYKIPPGYRKENLSFVAYVIEARGFSGRVSLNSRSAGIGKSVDF